MENLKLVLDELSKIVGSAGEMAPSSGGYIIIVKSDDFPFSQVFKKLLSSGLDVWIVEADDKLKIVSKPRAE